MKCRKVDCDGNTFVTNSRKIDGRTAIMRRRECKKCGQRFTTFEVIGRNEYIPAQIRTGVALINRFKDTHKQLHIVMKRFEEKQHE